MTQPGSTTAGHNVISSQSPSSSMTPRDKCMCVRHQGKCIKRTPVDSVSCLVCELMTSQLRVAQKAQSVIDAEFNNVV